MYSQYRPLVWRNTHPYVLVDRHEDVTNPNAIEMDNLCDRSVTFYGYVRGTHLKPNMKVHVIGVGDYIMADVSVLPDPCPIPDKEQERTVRDYDSKKRRHFFEMKSDLIALIVLDFEKKGLLTICSTVQRRCSFLRQRCCLH